MRPAAAPLAADRAGVSWRICFSARNTCLNLWIFLSSHPCPSAAGSRSDPAVLNPSTHAHGRWCLEVIQALGLLPQQSSGGTTSGGGRGGTTSGASKQEGTCCRQPPPLHVGVSLGGTMLLELGCVVAPHAVGGAALVVPGGLLPGG